VIPQQPVATQQPLIPLLPAIIQQPQQPSGPISRGPRGNNPFWPF
jgi:hypothetical protein